MGWGGKNSQTYYGIYPDVWTQMCFRNPCTGEVFRTLCYQKLDWQLQVDLFNIVTSYIMPLICMTVFYTAITRRLIQSSRVVSNTTVLGQTHAARNQKVSLGQFLGSVLGQFLGTVSGVKPTPPGTKRSVWGQFLGSVLGQFLGTVSGAKPTPPGTKRSVWGRFGVRVGSVFGDRFWGQFLGTVSGVKPTPPGTKRSVLGSNICGQVPKGQLWGQTFVARNQKVNLGSNTCCKEPKGQFWGQTFVARNQKFSFGVKHLSLGTKRSVLGSVFGLDSRRQGPKGQFWGQLLGPFLGSVLGQTYAARNQKFSFSTRNQKDSFSDNHFFKTSPESNTIILAIVKMNKTGASQVAPLKFFQ